jgi:hypothetical protein
MSDCTNVEQTLLRSIEQDYQIAEADIGGLLVRYHTGDDEYLRAIACVEWYMTYFSTYANQAKELKASGSPRLSERLEHIMSDLMRCKTTCTEGICLSAPT